MIIVPLSEWRPLPQAEMVTDDCVAEEAQIIQHRHGMAATFEFVYLYRTPGGYAIGHGIAEARNAVQFPTANAAKLAWDISR